MTAPWETVHLVREQRLDFHLLPGITGDNDPVFSPASQQHTQCFRQIAYGGRESPDAE